MGVVTAIFKAIAGFFSAMPVFKWYSEKRAEGIQRAKEVKAETQREKDHQAITSHYDDPANR